MVTFGLGAVAFLLFPTVVIQVLNASGRPFGMTELDARQHEFWAVLAVGYMVLVTAFCYEAQRQALVAELPVRFLLLGKLTSSLVSLLYFVVAVHAFAFLANFFVDGGIVLITWGFYRAAFAARRQAA